MVVIREGFSVTLDAQSVNLALKAAPQTLALELRRALEDVRAEHKRVTRTMFVPRVGDNSGTDRLQYGRGGLFRSVGGRVFGESIANLGLALYADGSVRYGPTHELGDFNRTPTTKKLMTIPLEDAKTPAGSLKGGMRIVKRGDRYYTASGLETRVIETPDGRKFVVAHTGFSRLQRALARGARRQGAVTPSDRTLNAKRKELLLYALRERVRIPARPFFGRAWDASAEYRQRRFQTALDNTVLAMGGG